ncbi:MAG TPA: hypothetical protein VGB27_05395 [Candidatus Binatia bacterium]|jgi:hypothetical protein
MLKLSILIGVSSATVYAGTAEPGLLDGNLFIIALCVTALFVAILAQVSEGSRLWRLW